MKIEMLPLKLFCRLLLVIKGKKYFICGFVNPHYNQTHMSMPLTWHWLFMDARTTWSWSMAESLDCGAVWQTAVFSCPVTTGCDGISLDTLTYCVFISSGQAPMQLQPWINAALSRVFPLGAAVHSLSGTHMLSNPSKCKLAARAATNIQVEWQFSLQTIAYFRYHIFNIVKKQLCATNTVKPGTPVYCVYLMCVYTAYLIEIWLG